MDIELDNDEKLMIDWIAENVLTPGVDPRAAWAGPVTLRGMRELGLPETPRRENVMARLDEKGVIEWAFDAHPGAQQPYVRLRLSEAGVECLPARPEPEPPAAPEEAMTEEDPDGA